MNDGNDKTARDDQAEQTIVAIATPPGEGGVGIVRLSGSRAEEIGTGLFRFDRRPAEIESHRLYPGIVILPDDAPTGAAGARDGPRGSGAAPGGGGPGLRDRALFVLMRAPRSYTGQDVVELQCHGSPLLLASIVTAGVSMGARLARPGEFTQRAFMNGKIDLVQAEAVADLIAASTAGALSISARHHLGALSQRLAGLRGRLVSLLADIEASVDFSDQDADTPGAEAVAREIGSLYESVTALLGSYRAGRVYREGARMVIAGRPNVGKSSLLNRLLGRPRAIVAPEPGTTTDTVEDVMDIGGIPVRVVDTCGLREAAGTVEREGVLRTKRALETADVTLLVGEATAGPGSVEREAMAEAAAAGRPVVLVMNKVDLVTGEPEATEEAGVPTVFTSALTGAGIDRLTETVRSLVTGASASAGTDELITNARHYAALLAAARSLERARGAADGGISAEFIALDIREALAATGEITGDVTTDEVLGAIFSRFCIGK
jgi:tRNA modification GTPase